MMSCVSQKLNHVAISVCQCIVLLDKSNYPNRRVNAIVLGVAWGCDGETSHQTQSIINVS